MLEIEYGTDFLRKYKKLSSAHKLEIMERIEEFRDVNNHQRLKVHKLKGSFADSYAFSVNYNDRIIFRWNKDKAIAYLLHVGDHSIYE